ncbi:MAG TPA: YggT family protein [Pseudobacteroides sp.]|uniref:YggT family protein n=1 Tax=Pseudobacteroides sp. TaxID=1968840 RepID=UPI002F957CC5
MQVFSIFGLAIVIVLQIVKYAVILRALLSFLPIQKDNQFINILYQVTEPVLVPIKTFLGRTEWGKNSMIDVSPIIAIFLIWILSSLISSIFGVPQIFSVF